MHASTFAKALTHICAKSKSLVREFAANKRGNVAAIFGIASVPITMLIATSLEYSTAAGKRTQLQVAVDAAVLAAGNKEIPTAQRENYARAKFEAMLPADIRTHLTSHSFTLNMAATHISGSAYVDLPKRFQTMLGSDAIRITAHATSKVARPQVRQLDIVMCIDATGSMQPTINAVKTNALNFQTNLANEIAARGIDNFESMRVKVVFFRDYGGNSSGGYWTGPWWNRTWVSDPTYYGDRPPMKISSFFDLATQTTNFQNFVNPEIASGGGDIPESGLECVNEAMSSTWTAVGSTITSGPHVGKVVEEVFPVIVVWTDAPAHPPSHARSLLNPNYPSAAVMPRTYADLLAKWNNNAVINQANKLLVFFGDPNNYLPSYPSDDGWAHVKNWPGFYHAGSLTDGSTLMVTRIADAIASKQKAPTLSQ